MLIRLVVFRFEKIALSTPCSIHGRKDGSFVCVRNILFEVLWDFVGHFHRYFFFAILTELVFWECQNQRKNGKVLPHFSSSRSFYADLTSHLRTRFPGTFKGHNCCFKTKQFHATYPCLPNNKTFETIIT